MSHYVRDTHYVFLWELISCTIHSIQTADNTHGLPAMLTIDLTSFCDTQSTSILQLRPIGNVMFLKLEEPTILWLPTLQTYRSAYGIDQTKN